MDSEKINEITERMASRISFNTEIGSFARDILRAVAVEMAMEENLYSDDLNTRFIDTATGIDLDMCVRDKGKQRIEAISATGEVKIIGANGTVIKKGTIVTSSSNEYRTIEEKEIVNVSTFVKVEAVQPGEKGNCEVGEITKFKEDYIGLTSVTNLTKISGGRNQETDDELKARVSRYIQYPPISWNQYYFEDKAKEIAEVDKVKCIPCWNGRGTVRLIVTEKTNPIATEEVKNKIKNLIDNEIISDINLTVDSVVINDIALDFEAELNTDYLESEAKEEIKAALNEFLFKNIFKERILYFEIASIINNCKSIEKLSDLKINGIKDDLVIEPDKLCRVNTITIGGIS